MTIKIPIAEIQYPLKNTQCSVPSHGLKNKGQVNNSPAFCGVKEIKGERTLKFVHWLGGKMKASENRLIMGATALLSQPWFDIYNKKVDDETRSYSVARTFSKIIAGTTVGFGVREVCRFATENFCVVDKNAVRKDFVEKFLPNSKRWLAPKNIEQMSAKQIKNYTKAFGTYMAIVAMIVTNFAIDAPLTKFLTNVLKKQFDKGGSFKSVQKPSTEGGQK